MAPAYAGAPDCVIERIGGGDPIVVSETESCLRILVRGTATLLISGQAKIDMGKGMLVGMGQDAEMLVEMAANPKETLKQVIMAVDAMLDDPSQAMQDIANGYIDQIANIMIGLESGDYEMVGRELGGLSVNVVVSLATSGAGVAVAGAKALNTAVKAMRARAVPNVAGGGRFTPTQPLDASGKPIVRTNDRGGVLVQPNGSVTCGQHACGMVLNTQGIPVAVDDIIADFPPTSKEGTSITRVSAALRANDVNTLTLSNGNLTVDNLANFTATGRPSIAMVKTGPNTNHFVVVDGVTTRGGQRVVAIRDPAGTTNKGVYYETVTSFEGRFMGNAIRILE